MQQAQNAPVYRICAVSDQRWDVLRDSSADPVASFSDKHAALAYAMSLARGGADWQLAPGHRQAALRNIFRLDRRARGSGV